MKKLALFGTALALSAGALVVSHKSHAADHQDSPNVKMAANVMADINDVYTWMDGGGSLVNLAMTVSPADDGTHSFGPSVQYVFHATSHAGADNKTAYTGAQVETKVICTFKSNTSGQCWVTEGSTVKDYITGDFSSEAGVTSKSGKVKVFAGRRSDPFFFNLAGLKTAVGAVEAAVAANQLTFKNSGCPNVPPATATTLQGALSTAPATAIAPCAAGQGDCFINFNTMAIVMQVDKSLLLHDTDTLLSVWGSSHAAS